MAPFGAVGTSTLSSCQPAGTVPTAGWTNTDSPASNRLASKNVVWVRVDITFRPVTPLVQNWTPVTSASATMVVN